MIAALARRVKNRLEGASRRAAFLRDYLRFRALRRSALRSSMPAAYRDWMPRLGETAPTASFDRHYVYHTAWAARVLAATRPTEHIDISSSLFFAGIASAFVPVRFYDYRPPELVLENLHVGAADLCRLPFPDRSIASLSCMHVVEHVGLGRYGDPLDPDGDLKAAAELQRVLAPGGSLLIVVPVGRERVCFNAHRVYAVDSVLRAFPELTLKQFALVPQDPGSGGLVLDPPPALVGREDYGCGCFWLERAA